MPLEPRKNIVLTGFMAVGKSVVGQRLAHRLNRAFTDLDVAIENRAGMKVAEIFASRGEPYFRKIEARLLRELLSAGDGVIATGGGAVLDERNLLLLREAALLICLTATPETILRRAATGGNQRPLLQAKDKLGEIVRLLSAREHAYMRAHLTIDTEGRSVDEVVEEIIGAIEKIA